MSIYTKPPFEPIREPHSTTLHDVTWVDPYHWMRERKSRRVLDHLKAENAYTDGILASTKPLQEELYTEILSHVQQTDVDVPHPDGPYYYYERTAEGDQYPYFCRKPRDPNGPPDYTIDKATEEIILDGNLIAKGHEFSSIRSLDISDDHHLAAYCHDTEGDEICRLLFKDLRTGQMLPDVIEEVSDGVEWASDNKTIFYTILNDAHRPYKVMRHVLGTEESDDVEVFHEPDERFEIALGKSRCKRYICVCLRSAVTSEEWLIDSSSPLSVPFVFLPRKQNVEYSAFEQEDRWLIVTNDDEAINFKVMAVDLVDWVPGTRTGWKDLLPYDPTVKTDSLTVFKNHVVIWERRDGFSTMSIMDSRTGAITRPTFPDQVFTVSKSDNELYDTNVLRFLYESMITPEREYDYNMDTHSSILLKERPVLHYDRTLFRSERIWATSPDGTKVPITMAYHRDLKKDGNNFCYLSGYGSYGAEHDPYFSISRLVYLDRRFVWAFAHPRGGGELGRTWYESGKLLCKKNTFIDFISCARTLAEEGYTRPDKICIHGGSAGGLLIGATLNMAPDICKVAVADVPFVDIINTMLDPSLPLTVGEYEEWGNPADKTFFEYMRSYSPYDNVSAQKYPHILAIGGLNDVRVQYWEPAKWVSRLRDMKTDDNLVLLKTYMGEGHAGASGRYDMYKEIAFETAYVLKMLEAPITTNGKKQDE